MVNDLNALLIEAHNPRRVWIDNTLAIATLYLSTLVHTSHYKKVSPQALDYMQMAGKS